MQKRYSRSFFQRPTLKVAQELIGARIHFNSHTGIITETEAYIGQEDPACHAAKGITPRTEVMFGIAGMTYIYLIYGMYHCLNIVTEAKNFPAAVLIRGIICETTNTYLNGPGKLCKAWEITKEHNNLDICKKTDFFISKHQAPTKTSKTPRIGIKVGTDKLWRFVMSNKDIKNILMY